MKSSQFVSCYSSYIQVEKSLRKNQSSVVFSSKKKKSENKKQKNKQTNNKTHTQAARQRKLDISDYNLKYPATSRFTVC